MLMAASIYLPGQPVRAATRMRARVCVRVHATMRAIRGETARALSIYPRGTISQRRRNNGNARRITRTANAPLSITPADKRVRVITRDRPQ